MWRALLIWGIVSVSAATQAAQLDWLKQSQFFSYTPSEFHFEQDKPIFADRKSIAKDLRLLRHYSNGLILYSTDRSTEHILEIASELKFNAVILGIWTITDNDEINRAVELARRHPSLVRAIAVGNEGLFWNRYHKMQLTKVMKIIRASLPNVALTTTEPFASYLGSPVKLDCGNQDFMLPTIHPIFENWFTPGGTMQSVEFVENIVMHLSQRCNKYVLVKETGVPSGPWKQSYSEQQQRIFWLQLLAKMKTKPNVSVALFEAFDAPWKVAEIKKLSGVNDEREQYWGWFTHERKPKAVVGVLKARH